MNPFVLYIYYVLALNRCKQKKQNAYKNVTNPDFCSEYQHKKTPACSFYPGIYFVFFHIKTRHELSLFSLFFFASITIILVV